MCSAVAHTYIRGRPKCIAAARLNGEASYTYTYNRDNGDAYVRVFARFKLKLFTVPLDYSFLYKVFVLKITRDTGK